MVDLFSVHLPLICTQTLEERLQYRKVLHYLLYQKSLILPSPYKREVAELEQSVCFSFDSGAT